MLETAARTKLWESAGEFQGRIDCIRVVARDLRIGMAQISPDLPRHVLMEFGRDPHRQAHWPACSTINRSASLRNSPGSQGRCGLRMPFNNSASSCSGASGGKAAS